MMATRPIRALVLYHPMIQFLIIVVIELTDIYGLCRQTEITLKCDPGKPGKGTIPSLTGTFLPSGHVLYVNILEYFDF